MPFARLLNSVSPSTISVRFMDLTWNYLFSTPSDSRVQFIVHFTIKCLKMGNISAVVM
jgi:hypothetical protein